MVDPFFMVSLEIFSDRLMALGKQRGLPLREVDNGYLAHTVLGELFGDLAPRPFALHHHRGRRLSILGYSESSAEALRSQADIFAEPPAHASCDWPSLASKPMPANWRKDSILGFRVRACPVVRRSGPGPAGERPGREMDVYLAHIEEHQDEPQPRGDIYVDWLRAVVSRSGGATIENARVNAFSLRHFVRRDSRRKPTQVPAKQSSRQQAAGRPDVTFEGTLRVSDPAEFRLTLRKGIGRHKAFGFGMILLRAIR
jgi:CRISPR system Cascade subunit CasE